MINKESTLLALAFLLILIISIRKIIALLKTSYISFKEDISDKIEKSFTLRKDAELKLEEANRELSKQEELMNILSDDLTKKIDSLKKETEEKILNIKQSMQEKQEDDEKIIYNNILKKILTEMKTKIFENIKNNKK